MFKKISGVPAAQCPKGLVTKGMRSRQPIRYFSICKVEPATCLMQVKPGGMAACFSSKDEPGGGAVRWRRQGSLRHKAKCVPNTGVGLPAARLDDESVRFVRHQAVSERCLRSRIIQLILGKMRCLITFVAIVVVPL